MEHKSLPKSPNYGSTKKVKIVRN